MCVCVCVYSVRPAETSVSTPTFFPLDSLQKKLKDLEEENKSLRFEVHTHAQTLTCTNTHMHIRQHARTVFL